MFNVLPSSIPGCHEILPRVVDDERGRFVKVFHGEAFRDLGLEANFAEEYYSRSRKGVVRGMHFQLPPADHVKLVYCVEGDVFDVVSDLRVGSPTFGESATFVLSASKANLVYIPRGLAHGFCVMSEAATLVYKVTSVHSPRFDAGILWNSVGINWPVESPILSERDRGFAPLSRFDSPFVYERG